MLRDGMTARFVAIPGHEGGLGEEATPFSDIALKKRAGELA